MLKKDKDYKRKKGEVERCSGKCECSLIDVLKKPYSNKNEYYKRSNTQRPGHFKGEGHGGYGGKGCENNKKDYAIEYCGITDIREAFRHHFLMVYLLQRLQGCIAKQIRFSATVWPVLSVCGIDLTPHEQL